jgi:hypothetical protein
MHETRNGLDIEEGERQHQRLYVHLIEGREVIGRRLPESGGGDVHWQYSSACSTEGYKQATLALASRCWQRRCCSFHLCTLSCSMQDRSFRALFCRILLSTRRFHALSVHARYTLPLMLIKRRHSNANLRKSEAQPGSYQHSRSETP